MHIVYYITGHGFGHAVRSTTIINALPEHVNVSIKTAVPKAFFDRELKRPFNYCSADFDCGCLQHDSVSVDIKKTIKTFSAIHSGNNRILPDEVAWSKVNGVTGIVSDITPFAFDVARKSGIPSIAATNFTWYDIYNEYCTADVTFRDVVGDILRSYRQADLLLALSPALPMDYFRKKISIPVVGRVGKAETLLFAEKYGINVSRKVALIYIGEFGLPDAQWKNLVLNREWEFFGLQHLDNAPANYHELAPDVTEYADLTASADCMISKLGYGVVAESMLNRTPILYLPRRQFAEYPMLDKAVRLWGGGELLTVEKFLSCEWMEALERVTTRKLPRISENGAERCAAEICRFFSDR